MASCAPSDHLHNPRCQQATSAVKAPGIALRPAGGRPCLRLSTCLNERHEFNAERRWIYVPVPAMTTRPQVHREHFIVMEDD
jgi:hypothetical protein